MFKRILVPLDGSKLAEQALPLAVRLARASGGTLLLLRVDTTLQDLAWYSTEGAFMMPDTLAAERAAIRRYMDRLVASEVLADISVNAVHVEGDAAQSILTAITEQHADVVVIGSHGRTGLKRWMIGSIAQKVARQSPVPVLVLRTADEAQATLPGGEGQPVRVMVPLDGSTFAEAALQPAVALSEALSAPGSGALHLVQVLPLAAHSSILPEETAWVATPGGVVQGGSLLPIHSPEHEPTDQEALAINRAQALDRAHAYLIRVKNALHQEAGHDLQITTAAVIDIDIASALLGQAEGGEVCGAHISDSIERCVMIAMATHGRSGPSRWMMGSITERVLDATRLPLLMVRPPKQ